jgi:hypothetical protein
MNKKVNKFITNDLSKEINYLSFNIELNEEEKKYDKKKIIVNLILFFITSIFLLYGSYLFFLIHDSRLLFAIVIFYMFPALFFCMRETLRGNLD